MLESKVEEHLRLRVEEAGGFCKKFVSPQNSGVPDRIVCLRGLIVFVETKAPDKTPRPLQKQVIGEMRGMGALVAVIPDLPTVDRFVSWLIASAPKAVPKQPAVPSAGFCEFKNIVPKTAPKADFEKKAAPKTIHVK